jgi:hypothetical protein
LFRKSEDLRRAALVLFVLMALIAIPTYVSGAAARGAIIGSPNVSADLISVHQDAATLAFLAMVVTGWLSWFALWQYRRFSRPYGWSVPAVLVLSVVTLALMIKTGSVGGDINHPEIHTGGELAAAAGQIGLGAALATWIKDSACAWPTLEAGHFMGMAVLFGVVLLVAMRVLGLVRSVPFSAFHRLLPLGAFGFMLNVATGMVFFIADHERYITMTNSFFPKIALIAIAGVAVLYFTMFDKPWELKAGDRAPLAAKAMAVATVLMWSGVIIYGRLLPYLEGTGG